MFRAVTETRGHAELDDGFHEVLASETRRHDNLIVVDWETKILERPEWLAPDGTHLTPEEYRTRACEIARAVRSC